MEGVCHERGDFGRAKRILSRLTTLLGPDVFFVPCEWGTKKPLVTNVERPFESTKTPAYRALFEVQEVNVRCISGKRRAVCVRLISIAMKTLRRSWPLIQGWPAPRDHGEAGVGWFG
jgi:hypothetical protein